MHKEFPNLHPLEDDKHTIFKAAVIIFPNLPEEH